MHPSSVKILKKYIHVCDDNIELSSLVAEVLEAISDMDCDSGIIETSGHVRQKSLGHSGYGLVNIDQGSCFDAWVFQDLPQNATIPSTDDKDVLWIGMRVER